MKRLLLAIVLLLGCIGLAGLSSCGLTHDERVEVSELYEIMQTRPLTPTEASRFEQLITKAQDSPIDWNALIGAIGGAFMSFIGINKFRGPREPLPVRQQTIAEFKHG